MVEGSSKILDLHRGGSLEVVTDGPSDATALVYHSGTPSAALLFPPMVQAARQAGLFVLSYSRPGYSVSTEQHGRSVADAAADTAAVLDLLGVDTFLTLGWSGGGPHALACAALLPERCRGAVTLAGVAPFGAAGLDFLAGMGDENIEEFSLTIEGEDALVPFLEENAKGLSSLEGSDVAAALGGLVTEVDKAALTGEFASYMAAVLKRSVSHGIAGWRDDDLAFVRPWGFDLESISVPVAVWQGAQDRMVPFAHGEWLASNVPGAEARLSPTDGHLSLGLEKMGEILEDLVRIAA
jgi:pimeloyl-ACP methyl ester carboxylesterase